ncbi:MAG: thioredoxin [Bacteroidales bacterium]
MKIIKLFLLVFTTTILLSCKGTGTTTEGKTVYLTQDEFVKKVFNYKQSTEWKFLGDKPAIIDFYADWCKPCKLVAPVLEDLAKQYDGKVIVYKVNVDKERELAGAFQITSIPTVLFIPKAGQPQAAVGVQSKEEYTKIIESVLIPSIQ